MAVAFGVVALGCDVESSWLSVVSRDGEAARLRVRYELATSEQARRDGLQTRLPLEPDEGLLLEFPLEGEVCIHNSAVPYPIDVVFAGADDRVVRDVLPFAAFDTAAICVASVKRVLEVRAGVGAGVVQGDRLVRP